MQLLGKVAIVAGAGRGIGRSIALELARAGCQLSLAARSADQLVAVVDEVQKQGRQAITVTTDVTDESAVGVLVERTNAIFSRVDILVNAANYLHRSAIEDCDTESWRRLVDTNLTGPYLCMRAVVPIMRAQRSGKIINVADSSAVETFAGMTAYSAVKSGLVGMTRALAAELNDSGVQVNAVCPRAEEAAPEDVASAAIFLAGPGADHLSGQVVAVS